jgi:S-adenosylmethionine:tRNA ribosyltransferase-isomerase
MKTSDFFFDLPQELIAQKPLPERSASKLLVLDRETGKVSHRSVSELPALVEPGTLMVFNNSKVRKARIYGEASTGGTVEFLLIRPIGETRWEALVSRAKKQKEGKSFSFPGGIIGTMAGGTGETRYVDFSIPIDDAYLERHGHVPLPPYIRREDTSDDESRYQTVYSAVSGSVAAPTAGLHFTPTILEELKKRGVEESFVTLHVGLGTFLPVRTEAVEDHRMHAEEFEIPRETAQAVNRAKREGRPVLAVGTTSVRTLESAFRDGEVKEGRRETRLFIYPGYRFQVVDSLFTNFHTPGSSLIILVSAFAGIEKVRKAYAEAIENRYRFFSYGDAMLIQGNYPESS